MATVGREMHLVGQKSAAYIETEATNACVVRNIFILPDKF